MAGRNVKSARAKRNIPMTERRERFLGLLRETANVSRAAREAGIPTSTLYSQRRRMPTFSKSWDMALDEALDTLEESLIARARDGVEKPIFYGGELKGAVRVYSDALGMFLLRARRPHVYDRISAAGAAAATQMSAAEAQAEFTRRLQRVQGRAGKAQGQDRDED